MSSLKGGGTEFEAVMKTCFLQKIEEFVPQLGKSLKDKMERMRKLEKQRGKLSGEDLVLNLEGAVKNAAYIHFRSLYNRTGELKIGEPHATALYFFIGNTAIPPCSAITGTGNLTCPTEGFPIIKNL